MLALHRYLKLVFFSVKIGVGFVIRRVERYDLVKIKPMESEAEYRFAYDSITYDLVKTRLSESQEEISSIVIGPFFCFCFRLQQPSFHVIRSERVISRIGIKRKHYDSSNSDSFKLMTPLTTPIFNFH